MLGQVAMQTKANQKQSRLSSPSLNRSVSALQSKFRERLAQKRHGTNSLYTPNKPSSAIGANR